MEQRWGQRNWVIHPSTKVLAPASTFYEIRSLRKKSVSRTLHFVQSVGVLSALIYGLQEKIKYGQSEWYKTVPALLVFRSTLFYVHITEINITKLAKQSNFADS